MSIAKSSLKNFLCSTSLFALLLAGCEVGPDYHPPEDNSPKTWESSAEVQQTKEHEVIDQTWWQNFHDPVLNQLIDKAVASNWDLKIAEQRIVAARAQLSSADWDLAPKGDLGYSGLRQGNRITFPGGSQLGTFGPLLKKPFNTFQAGFDATWELDVFGQTRREIESASAEVQASEASRDDALVTLLAEVARTYFNIREYQDQIDITERTDKADKNSYEIAKQRFNVGEAPHIDVDQALAQMHQAESQLPYYHNLLIQSELAMDVLLGEQPGYTRPLVDKAGPVPVSSEQLVLAAPASVIANRPDIRMAERKLASATAQQGEAVAKFFPDISLNGFLGLLSTTMGSLGTPASKSWEIGGAATLPLLNYGTLSANLDATNAQQQEALATYRKTVISALSDVEQSVTAYVDQQKYQDSLAKTVEDNRRYNAAAKERYRDGMTSFIDVLDAERTLFQSESQLAESKANVSGDLVAVYKSLGGGWQQTAPASATASSPNDTAPPAPTSAPVKASSTDDAPKAVSVP